MSNKYAFLQAWKVLARESMSFDWIIVTGDNLSRKLYTKKFLKICNVYL
jgi:spermidine synthase